MLTAKIYNINNNKEIKIVVIFKSKLKLTKRLLVYLAVIILLVVICFTCHVHKARDLRETRICIIDTILENNNHPTTNTAYIL